MKKHDPEGHVLDPQDTTVVAILRGGIFFGAGLYFALGCRFELYDPHPKHAEFVRPATKNVILADSVINTGVYCKIKTQERPYCQFLAPTQK